MATKVNRQEINQRRIASYNEIPYAFRQGKDGMIRLGTQEDYENTLKAEGFEPYDPTDEELLSPELRGLPFFQRRSGKKG